ncbi:dynamin family protein [Salibacterium halotolerans]|uniref:Small GTP-binding protein domain-containing protein n=1 Tax=Salibacterium halotolerans TaxID=1884432 RepID=A0A1I5Q9F8_9BACI|nr:dynamin family protein [Salibacterium halotolerans]SFP42893.1 small GTP-binding protein domain-containing protein [Salibacterium halotolerans]
MPEVQMKDAGSLLNLPFSDEDEKRLQALVSKRQNPAFEVAFCGHFSAGKSTLLNELLGRDLLPSSPIPTSANIISIQYGDPGLAITTSDGKEQRWQDEIPWDEVKSWGMNGEEIKHINIYIPFPFLSTSTRLFDTPGVDSTDPNHQLVTADQLYTADCIVYVTDYNHVQSETNLRFLKEMSRENKPILLVVNQIDKHNENEVRLTSFKNGLRTTLSRAGIQPMELFFTSMKEPDYPFNESDRLASFLKPLLYYGGNLSSRSLPMHESGAVHQLMERLKEEKEEAYETWQENLLSRGMDPKDAEQAGSREEEIQQVEQQKKAAVQLLYDERNQLLKDVTLFPYTTTEKVRHWLESCHRQFKKGLLFTRRKTEEERAKRKEAVLEELNEKVKTELLFHVKNILLGEAVPYMQDPASFETQVQEWSFTVDGELLERFVPTSEFDRQFVYTFTEKMADAVGKQLKAETESFFQDYEEALKTQYDEKKAALLEKQENAEDVSRELREWEQAADEVEKKLEECRTYLKTNDGGHDFWQLLRGTAEEDYPEGNIPDIVVTEEEEEDSVVTEADAPEQTKEQPFISAPEVDDSFVEPIRRYLHQYGDRPLFEQEKKKLARLLEQYDNNTVTVSLFGAFSAGKSSFINAMIGERVLPAAPNPTTSAVNRIQKSTLAYPHGTVVLDTKEEAVLEQEIQAVSRELGTDLNLETLQSWKKPNQNRLTDYQRTYADYLFTLQQSLKKKTVPPGVRIETEINELQDWVGKEEYACLIQQASIYYDCAWTEKGLVFVDTPGIHSIHGRHTNVAFEQMTQSSAVLYVTYYNHAFSKADQVFLQQMAGVNEEFDTNRLYFIINASDLADSKTELNVVREHVREQLLQSGIQDPHVFTLSSKDALALKQQDASAEEEDAFTGFEHYFETITMDTLKADHLDQLYQHGMHMYRLLRSLLDDADSGDNPEQIMTRRLESVDAFKQEIETLHFEDLLPSLRHELQQQCSYLQERVKLMALDYFPEAVNPAVLNGSSKREQKARLQGALQEMEGLARTFLEREMQTIIFRLQEHGAKGIYRGNQRFRDAAVPNDLNVAAPDSQALQLLPEKEEAAVRMTIPTAPFLDYYQSGKDFFGNRAVQKLKEDFSETVRLEAGKEIASLEERLQQRLNEHMREQAEYFRIYFQNEADQEIERIRWLFDSSKKPALEEETSFLQKHLQK